MTDFLAKIIQLYSYVLLMRVLCSWLPPESKQNQLYYYLLKITEPVLKPFREVIPTMRGFDFSPVIVFLILQFIADFLLR